MIGKTISHYKIIKQLGAGGMGEVYLSEDTKLKRKVALKFLPPQLTVDKEAKARFEREAQAAAALNHPNIVTIFEIGEFKNQIFIAMEYVAGDTLRTKIDEGQLTIDESINFTNQICEGLAKSHQAGIVHRDIKPENILIDSGWRNYRIGKIEPLFEKLRQDNRFEKRIERVKGLVDKTREQIKAAQE